ncbi:MAG: Pilus assembly protein, PilP [Deltaproteobacteria bacterium]|nr:Pilus assembly protein, PilP [Deltaproteobacteria bacterium]
MNRRRLSSLIIIFACLLFGISGLHAQTAKVPSPAAKPGQEPSAATAKEEPAKAAQPAKPADTAPTNASAPAKPSAGQAGKVVPPKYNVEDFSFGPEVSRNPFEPILLLKAKTSRGVSVKASKAKAEKADKLDYELEELRLVGVIKSDTGGMIAMMEDSQGKGIFFRKGDYLNKNLWVMDVSASGVMLGYKAKGEIKKIAVDIPTKN